MVNVENLSQDVAEILRNGQIVIFQYYSVSGADSGYDDDVTYTRLGSVVTSGLVLPMNQSKYSSDFFQVQQGRAFFDDSKVYVVGSIPTGSIFTINIGSKIYAPIDNGIEVLSLYGNDVYKKIYCRFLPTGSLN